MEEQVPTPGDVAARAIISSENVIDAAIARVERLSVEPISEHVDAFEAAHRALQEHLNEAADG